MNCQFQNWKLKMSAPGNYISYPDYYNFIQEEIEKLGKREKSKKTS